VCGFQLGQANGYKDASKNSSGSTPFGYDSDAWIGEVVDLFPETRRSAIGTGCSVGTPIGIVFLTTSAQHDVPSGEISIGIVLDQSYRGLGFGRQAVKLLMKWVFDDMKFHRMQAVILESPSKVNAMTLFTRLYVTTSPLDHSSDSNLPG
jgi:Acetyltransferase (GNAT) domain